ncbi:hypothetical protein HZC00_02405 [Candidatus Kaiserbacteria bacterium]|nr:hypothetical protein [Candidatus Kaiserbacteria bacterium]
MSEKKEQQERMRAQAILATKTAKRLPDGSTEANKAWLEASKLKEMLASMLSPSDLCGHMVRREALNAAIQARAMWRAKELCKRYGSETGCETKEDWDVYFVTHLFECVQADIDLDTFESIIHGICVHDTSADPVGWSEESPLWGHCAVIALLIQEVYGGTIYRQSLKGIEGFEHFGSHYSNVLHGGLEADFALGFLSGKLDMQAKRVWPRERILNFPGNREGYEKFKNRFIVAVIRWMAEVHPILEDEAV